MRSLVLSILVIFVMRTNAKELMISMGNEQVLMRKVVDKLIDRMQDQWLPHHADLDITTLGKPGRIPLQPRPLFQNSPIWLKMNRANEKFIFEDFLKIVFELLKCNALCKCKWHFKWLLTYFKWHYMPFRAFQKPFEMPFAVAPNFPIAFALAFQLAFSRNI